MTRRLTMLFAAFEALLVVGIGIAIPLVPLTLMWAFQYGFGPDWLVFWRGAVDVWLLGHGVDIVLVPDPVLVETLAIPGAERAVGVTIAVLGFALLTALLGVRAGRRVAETGHRLLGETTALVAFAALSTLATLSAQDAAVQPSMLQGPLLPTVAFGIGLVIGVLREGVDFADDPLGARVLDWLAALSPRIRIAGLQALRAGAASVAVVVLVASVAVAALLVANYAELIRLYEALHGGVVGGIAITAGQLALLPNVVVWAASWFIGPGFALGTASSVSPLGTALGPIPAVPMLGAIPTADLEYGFAGLAVPVAAAFVAGFAVRRALAQGIGDGGRAGRISWFAGVAVLGGATGGLVLGLLAWASAGSAGPGRLEHVGSDPVLVGAFAALEFAVGIALGLAAGAVGFADRDPAERPERRERPSRSSRRGGAAPDSAEPTTEPIPVVNDAAAAPPDTGPAAPPAPDAPRTPASAPAEHDDIDTAPIPVQPSS